MDGDQEVLHPVSCGDTPLTPTTPTRRNKRKMTEPKRRTDFSIKRLCPESPQAVAEDLDKFDGSREFPPDTPEPSTSPGTPSPAGERLHSTLPAGVQEGGVANSKGALPPPRTKGSRSRAKTHAKEAPRPHPLPPGGHMLPDLRMYPGGIHVDASGVRYLVAPPPVLPGGGLTLPNCGPLTGGSLPDEGPHSGSLSPGSPPMMGESSGRSGGRRTRKNYKNMTRERRVEANARERSRVHTISAAFDSLRQAVPSYSYNQKLSKLAILRIACNYIVALARLADMDYTKDQCDLSFADCVDMCTRTIQTEGRARRRH